MPFEISLLLFLVGFLSLTLHGKMLQYIFPISLPEKPLLDNNLCVQLFYYRPLVFIISPVFALVLLRSRVSWMEFGLTVRNLKQTMLFAFFGLAFTIFLFWLSLTLFGFRWITEYTLDGLIWWILFATILSVFAQTFFFIGVLFNRYLEREKVFLLAIISILAIQFFAFASLPWIITNIVGSTAKIAVTWKTRNIYGAALMGTVLNLIDIAIQIL